MAIYFPPFYCPKGSILEIIRNIEFTNCSLSEGQHCYVHDIKGYGFDLHPLWDATKIFRLTNSQMPIYFKILIIPAQDKLYPSLLKYKVTFKKDFVIKNSITIKKGERFYFELDKNKGEFYSLYDDYHKVLSLKATEVNEFLEFLDGDGINQDYN